jgi:hypothetical protein
MFLKGSQSTATSAGPEKLSSPLTAKKPPNPLSTLAINLSKTWHSHPTPLDTLEVEIKFKKLQRQPPLQLSHLSP